LKEIKPINLNTYITLRSLLVSEFDDFDLNIDEEALERANAERMAEQNEEAKALTEGDVDDCEGGACKI
jgi:hypothetical protein